MAEPGESVADHPVLAARRHDRSFLVLLTPEMFRRRWQSRLYGHLFLEYTAVPEALQRDLPHRDEQTCASLASRLGWLTFEEVRAVEPSACPWLEAPAAKTSRTAPYLQ